MTPQQMLTIIQRHREQLVAEVETALDGATAASFLLLTFAMDLTEMKIDSRTERLMREWAGNAVKEARKIGFGFEGSATHA